MQRGHLVEIPLPVIERRDDRERMMRCDTVCSDGNTAERRHVHARHEQAERGRTGIDGAHDSDADDRSEVTFHPADFVAGKAERPNRVLIREVWFTVDTTRAVADMQSASREAEHVG